MSHDLLNKIIGAHDNLLWMKDNSFERLIFLTRHGSHAYGTNTPESDEDFRGVCIPPREYFVGFLNNFEQLVRSDPDAQIFDIRKFFTLAVQNNPNVLEILFTDEADHIHVTKVGQEMLSHREEFISKAAKQRFIGYTRQQAHRIKTHRRWLINPMKAPPTRTDMGLSEKPEISKQNKEVIYSRIRKQLDEWNVDFEPFSDAQKIYLNSKLSDILVEMKITSDPQWAAAARTLGLEEKFIQLLILEKEFDARKEEWNNYQHWLETRNPIRAALEAKYEYDTKHGAHLVRLLRMGREILSEGKVIVKRPDREELLAIRNGLWSYDRLIDYADQMEKEITALYETSKLRTRPNTNRLDTLCQNLVLSFPFNKYEGHESKN